MLRRENAQGRRGANENAVYQVRWMSGAHSHHQVMVATLFEPSKGMTTESRRATFEAIDVPIILRYICTFRARSDCSAALPEAVCGEEFLMGGRLLIIWLWEDGLIGSYHRIRISQSMHWHRDLLSVIG